MTRRVIDRAKGLPCPACRDPRNEVSDTRAEQLGTVATLRRWRKCAACGHRWKTYELPAEVASALSSRGARGELRRALATLEQIRKALAAHERASPAEGGDPA